MHLFAQAGTIWYPSSNNT